MNHTSFAPRIACYLFPLLIFASGSAHAGLLRYEVVFNEQQVGRLVFDAELGAPSQNLWGSLVDWALGWEEVLLDTSNSTASANGRFFIDASGNVTDDGMESIICTAPPGFPFCAPDLVITGNPAFEGDDGSSIAFADTAIAGGIFLVGRVNGASSTDFGSVVYSGPTVVSLPATVWLIGAALIGMGGHRRRTVFDQKR